MSLNQNLGNLNRRKSIPVKVGNIIVGGDSPIIIQSMTNTDTADIDSTYKQILYLSSIFAHSGNFFNKACPI